MPRRPKNAPGFLVDPDEVSMRGMNVVYISYSEANRAHAGSLIEALQRSGCEVFDPQPRQSEADGFTVKNFERANVIVVLWSRHAEKSDPIQRELRFAQDWDKKVVLVRLEMIRPPRSLAFMQHAIIDGYSGHGWIATVVDSVWPLGAKPWGEERQLGSLGWPEDDPFSQPAPSMPMMAEPAPPPSRGGTILFNPPERMRVGSPDRVEVRLADADAAVAELYEGLRGRGVPRLEKLEIAPMMRVMLTADPIDFTVRALNTQDQLVRPKEVARWDFDVTPLRGGLRRLRLLASMRIKVEGKDEVVDLPSLEREIRVAVAPLRAVGQFCKQNWQWMAGTVAIPLVVWAAVNTGTGAAAVAQIRAWLSMAPAGQPTSAEGK